MNSTTHHQLDPADINSQSFDEVCIDKISKKVPHGLLGIYEDHCPALFQVSFNFSLAA
jgi:hypothetical protein